MQRNIIILAIIGTLTVGTCKPISIIGGKNKKSIFGHITDTVHKGFSSAIPDVVVKWDNDNRSKVMYDVESRLNNNIHTAASDLKDVVRDMDTKLAGNVDRAHTHLKDIANELDTVMHHNIDYAKSEFEQLIVQVDGIIQGHRDKLDEQVDNIEARFQRIVDNAVDTSVRKGAYALTGTSCTVLGLYMMKQMALYPDQCNNTGAYVATPACIAAGLAIIGNSDALGNNGIMYYLYPSTYSDHHDADSYDT